MSGILYHSHSGCVHWLPGPGRPGPPTDIIYFSLTAEQTQQLRNVSVFARCHRGGFPDGDAATYYMYMARQWAWAGQRPRPRFTVRPWWAVTGRARRVCLYETRPTENCRTQWQLGGCPELEHFGVTVSLPATVTAVQWFLAVAFI